MNKNQYSFSMWLQYLEKLEKKERKNLFDLRLIARKLGLLNLRSFFFTVGGTNGKGTTCALLEKFFLNSGYQVGLYTSPHLMNYTERVKINGVCLDENYHIFSFLNIECVKGNIPLTYFEFITLSALFLFKQYSLDIIILEVGVGGRLDATNIIDANLSVITNIGIDHTYILGKNRTSIGREKSGIFRQDKIAVIGEEKIPYSVKFIAQRKKAILKKINIDWSWNKNHDSWNFFNSNIQLYNLPLPKIPLPNAAISLAALYYSGFKINLKNLKNSISQVSLPGRFQTISRFPRIILDVAHNFNASLYLSKRIRKLKIKGKLYAIIGVLRDKDILKIIEPLKNQVYYWYASVLKNYRTANMYELKKNMPKNNTIFFDSIYNVWKNIKKILCKEDVVLVFGSFITVSEFIIAKNKN
ncbi:bifunctional tetrahydrofolate synthase/dihydrofolate synthase [Buchnera aphidicola (Melanaphis sacchari)]|uniref:Dihydrofolate synthase/folylpolyglutamate synthase n=1 Tax=Buchnera aphidicola (Melanaphis sacchari) TaxID=2173854 RepID=A0A2U8DGB5_9GAMM|nr:bifunctional tetrahydrofolate synthase/dihydrofolate synthase [Buchnera aphidicola]AWH90773.1 bifunctional tetrahydrofolate synthase/dihydrofolate synthase [Buchnera aphidicola (Melanaphis sacchari)]